MNALFAVAAHIAVFPARGMPCFEDCCSVASCLVNSWRQGIVTSIALEMLRSGKVEGVVCVAAREPVQSRSPAPPDSSPFGAIHHSL